MANSVKIEITAIDDASKVLDEVQAKLKQAEQQAKKTGTTGSKGLAAFGKSLGDMKSSAIAAIAPIAGVGAAVAGVGKFVLGSINDWVAYNDQIRKMSIAAGAAPEELSRMMQAADDLGVSMDALGSAFQFASRQGISPTLANIAKLSDELLAIEDPGKRAAEAARIFGRGWAEAAPFLLAGGKAIREGSAAIADGMVVTEESIKQTDEYRIALDALADSWTTLRNRIASDTLPTMTKVLDAFNQNIAASDQLAKVSVPLINALNSGAISMETYKSIVGQVSDGLIDAAQAQDKLNYEIAVAKDGYYRAGAQLVLLNRVEQDAVTTTDDLADSTALAATEMGQLASSATRTRAVLAEMRAKSVDISFNFKFPTSDIDATIKSFFDEQKWRDAGGQALEQAMGEMESMLKDHKITEAQANEMFANIFLASQKIQMELGQISAEEAANNIRNTLGVSLSEAWDLVKKIKKDANFTANAVINVTTNYTQGQTRVSGIGRLERELGEDLNNNGVIGRARGGPVVPNQVYMIGERGPEIFVPDSRGTIVPNHQAFGGDVYVGGITINTRPGQSAGEIAREVINQINRQTRLSRTAGLGYVS